MLHVETIDGVECEVAVIDVSPAGEITAIYDDELRDVFVALGELRRPRASDINEDSATGKFFADLSKIGGPILTGFDFKKDAERAEVAWITKHVVGYRGKT